MLLLGQTNNYITYKVLHFSSPQLPSITVQRNVEGGGIFVAAAWQEFIGKKSLANTWWLQLNKKTEHSNICFKGKEKTKDLSKWPFRSTEKGFLRATSKILPRQKKWEVETKNILQKLLPSSWEKQWIPR